ncbi:MAG: hypothetical protein JST44_07000 [Cyanobacteria bacterium SZAS LIN-5]|nr:hypothetical protein [Cyanobacteria bacterium SZAS LIN-5]RTL41776.1 MAG: hypothetical protein EKK48_12715 [Candidatus Melainabacteria bacterium]
MFKKFGYFALATVMLGCTCSRALADTIDEQYKEFLSRYNVAKNSKQITANQASELDRDLRSFSKTKRALRDAHADVTTAEDETKLNGMLNDIAQKLESMTANKAPAEAKKAPKAPKAK